MFSFEIFPQNHLILYYFKFYVICFWLLMGYPIPFFYRQFWNIFEDFVLKTNDYYLNLNIKKRTYMFKCYILFFTKILSKKGVLSKGNQLIAWLYIILAFLSLSINNVEYKTVQMFISRLKRLNKLMTSIVFLEQFLPQNYINFWKFITA